jgi:DNA-binding NarL/FixJ family response regulator
MFVPAQQRITKLATRPTCSPPTPINAMEQPVALEDEVNLVSGKSAPALIANNSIKSQIADYNSHPVANVQTCGWDSLTPAELRVAVLVPEGLTNTRIAQRLCLSRYTVETHLKRVFIKLHLTSRAALAAEAVRRGVAC